MTGCPCTRRRWRPIPSPRCASLICRRSSWDRAWTGWATCRWPRWPAACETAREGLRRLLGGGCRVVVADAATEEHLRILAAVLRAETGIVPCGTAGLAAALAEMMAGGAKRPAPAGGEPVSPGRSWPWWAARAASPPNRSGRRCGCTPVLRGWRSIRGNSPRRGERHDRAVARAAAEAGRRLAGHGALVLTVLPDPAESCASAAPAAIAAGLGEIAGRVAAEVSLGTLYLTGGDTVGRGLPRAGGARPCGSRASPRPG